MTWSTRRCALSLYSIALTAGVAFFVLLFMFHTVSGGKAPFMSAPILHKTCRILYLGTPVGQIGGSPSCDVVAGHITPAITVGLLFSKKITINRAAWYGGKLFEM